ncbi:amidohydrolase family protein [Burkholderia sp. 22PA0106]|uniref:amidohydrolase family protein n=1 Tax=Burkholderia sp. 22PA0106 TaxID=3237371 RepID=UPI0039C1F06E
MRVVDPHVHFWRPASGDYPWLSKPGMSFVGDARDLAHDYLPADLLREAGEIEIAKVVHVEANFDPVRPVEETRWLHTLADDRSAGHAGLPHGIVAAADLSAPDAEVVLAAHAAFANVRGIRQILNVHADPLYNYVARDYLADPAWRRQFGLLARYGLSFDMQLYPAQMPEAAKLARAHPDIPIVLDHAGMFVDRDTPAGFRAWRDGLRALAACPNVSVKLSGLAMFDHAWTVESLRPYVLDAIDAFGVTRAMFASNFPVDRLFGGYEALWRAYARIVGGVSDDERRLLFSANAERVYRI